MSINNNDKRNKTITSTRKIKCLGNCIEPGEIYLHPITLALYKNDFKEKKYCPSEFHYDINGPTYASLCNMNTDYSSLDIKKFMALPYLNLNMMQMLNIYKIDTIDSLISWVDQMIEKDAPFQHVNRIINIWIKFNYDDIVKTNDILLVVYEKISKKYWNDMKVDMKDIKKWFKTKDYKDFTFDLGSELYNLIMS